MTAMQPWRRTGVGQLQALACDEDPMFWDRFEDERVAQEILERATCVDCKQRWPACYCEHPPLTEAESIEVGETWLVILICLLAFWGALAQMALGMLL